MVVEETGERDRRERMERMEQQPTDSQPAKLRDNRTNRLEACCCRRDPKGKTER